MFRSISSPLLTFLIVIVYIEDGRCEKPIFAEGVTSVSVSEDIATQSTLFTGIKITDPDLDNPMLDVRCLPGTEADYDPCAYFLLIPTKYPGLTAWEGSIVLVNNLDYEERTTYTVTIQANDGVDRVDQTFTIAILNVQDQPPVDTGSLSNSFSEDIPVNTEILRVEAVDGDEGLNRAIQYSLKTNPGNNFRIDTNTGQIYNTNQLDRDQQFTSGIISIEVTATELLEDGTPDPDPNAQSTFTVTITLLDINDNAPSFQPSIYSVEMEESIPDGADITGLAIRVKDFDEGDNAAFRLSLLDYTDLFEIRPSNGQGSLAASIIVKDTSRIDYDVGTREYNIRILAEETETAEKRQSQGSVRILLTDANDNPPIFPEPAYFATLQETVEDDTYITTITASDLDSGAFGVEGIRYKLTGEGSDKFRIDPANGVVTVNLPSSCWKIGLTPCIDAEERTEFDLTIHAKDNFAEGLETTVPFTVTITDVNDNGPTMRLPEYVTYINESDTTLVPPVQVQADDPDITAPNNDMTYSIVGGNPTGLWVIDPKTGRVTPTRGVPFPPSEDYYLLTVEVKDPDPNSADTTYVRIFVNDQNNHSPIFTQNGYYEQTIPEDTPSGTVVETVTATDGDSISSPNGQVEYRRTDGGRGKFDINPSSGRVIVANGATFDYDVDARYQMLVVASDQGNPRRSSTATVVINILDSNNKKPYFQPTTVRADIKENEEPSTYVVTMTATDPDTNDRLVYTFVEPIKAWNDDSEIIDNPYKNWFNIDSNTGVVTVAGDLDRDLAIRWSAAVKVRDANGGPDQTATGTVVITILDVNERPPVFGPPWSPQNPFITHDVREGQGSGSYVITLVATDPSDSVDRYIMWSNPGGYFRLNEQTGVVTVDRPLDYEEISNTQFVVVAVDDGQPQLSSTATVNINVINVNDENPTFSRTQYETSLPENSPEGTEVIRVQASDRDLGDYGVTRYSLDDPRFTINSITGVITVAPGAILDREEQPLIAIQARAYDSPNDETVRKFTTVPVYITLLDVDEFPPKFVEPTYSAVVPETSPPQTSVIQLTGSDGDASPPNFEFVIQSGDPRDLFYIEGGTGLIRTRGDLDGQSGTYNLTVLVRNGDKTSVAYVAITVQEMDNNPPQWRFPNPDNQTVQWQENQGTGDIVDVFARDTDSGQNGIIDYGFDVDGEFRNRTDNFEIDPSGRIRSLKIFDREQEDKFILTLVARDRGRPYTEAKQNLFVIIQDEGDNWPEFETHKNCCTVPQYMDVKESVASKSYIGKVVAKDKDIGDNAVIVYTITGGNTEGDFRINSSTGEIYLTNTLDHERRNQYKLSILASNRVLPKYSPRPTQCANACNSSLLILYINVLDINEDPPQFSHQVFNACIATNAPFGKSVTQLTAIDPDVKSTKGVTYRIRGITPPNDVTPKPPADSFKISQTNGTVYSNALMELYDEEIFRLDIVAGDGLFNTSALLKIWVTPPSKEVIVTLGEKKEVVESNLDTYIEQISNATGYSIVCVSSVRYHMLVDVDGSRQADPTRTDLYLYVIDPNTGIIIDPEEVDRILKGGGLGAAAAVGSTDQWSGFIRDPVLIAIIVIAILIFIALLLLCICCWCLAAVSKKKKQNYIAAPLYLNGGTINPLWKGVEEQELTMKVQEGDTKLQAVGIENAGFDYTDESARMNQMSNGYIASHEEVHIQHSASGAGYSGSVPHIEADLLGSRSSTAAGGTLIASGTMSAGAGYSASLSNIGLSTMTRGMQTEEIPGALNISTEYLYPPSPSRIGATLTRNGVVYQGSHSGAYDYDDYNDAFSSGDGRTIGIQTYAGPPPAYNGHGSYQASHTEQFVDGDYSDGVYQGEIRLGSLPHPRSGSHMTVSQPSPVPSYSTNQQWQQQQQYQETRFMESREYRGSSTQDADIEYISF